MREGALHAPGAAKLDLPDLLKHFVLSSPSG